MGLEWPSWRWCAYSPPTNTWKQLAATSLSRREGHSAIWTGTEMLIWGGERSGLGLNESFFADGGRYNPNTDTWRPMAASPLRARWVHAAVWTGTEMLVWGGADENGALTDGAAYHPDTDT